jgi:hypothetical protein
MRNSLILPPPSAARARRMVLPARRDVFSSARGPSARWPLKLARDHPRYRAAVRGRAVSPTKATSLTRTRSRQTSTSIQLWRDYIENRSIIYNAERHSHRLVCSPSRSPTRPTPSYPVGWRRLREGFRVRSPDQDGYGWHHQRTSASRYGFDWYDARRALTRGSFLADARQSQLDAVNNADRSRRTTGSSSTRS